METAQKLKSPQAPRALSSLVERIERAHGGRARQSEIAANLQCSVATLRRLLAGAACSPELQARAAAAYPDLPVGEVAAPSGATPALVESQADYLLSELRTLERDLRETPPTDLQERLANLSQCAKITLALGRMTGVGITVSMRRILASPNWLILEEIIKRALHPHPNAGRAVAAALRDSGL